MRKLFLFSFLICIVCLVNKPALASTSNGTEGELLTLTILPAWYETTLARILYLLVGGFLLFGIRRYYLYRAAKRQIKTKFIHDKEMAEERNNLFIHVAHELRTPLSMIIAPLHEMLQQETTQQAYVNLMMAYQNAKSMEETCNRLLETSTVVSSTSAEPLMDEAALEETIKTMSQTNQTIGNDYKLLIIEDNANVGIYLNLMFSANYAVVLAKDGQEGVKMAQEEMPDIIVCDVTMPIKDGITCCREIKESDKTSNIPIILLTARVQESDIIKGLEAGADAYIFKPFNPRILKLKVQLLTASYARMKQLSVPKDICLTGEKEASIFVESIDKITQLANTNEFVASVVKIIEDNMYDVDFNVKKLSDIVLLSQSTLYRRIKQFTNITTMELIRDIRLRQAASLLNKQLYSVQEVAEKVGYNDVQTFRKHFVEVFRELPSCYGKNRTPESIP